MNPNTPQDSARVGALSHAYAALNRGDVSALIALMDDAIEWTEPSDVPGGGTYRGKDVVSRHFAAMRAKWAEGECRPERLLVAGDKVVVCSRIHVRFKGSADWVDGDVTDVYTFQGERAVHARVYADRVEAFRAAGLDPDGPH